MRPPATTVLRRRPPGDDDVMRVSHHFSHAGLLRDASRVPLPADRSRQGWPDAVVVPATRRASALAGIVERAAVLGSTVVVLCSRQANVEQVADRIGRVLGARGIVVEIDDDYAVPGLGLETASGSFAGPSGGRSSDLSVKRNVGLLLARLLGWRKIVFVDDDITLSHQDLARLAVQLDDHQIAGMACPEFPDNSVFCHARRLAKLPQDVFVTGAVLGVNCSDLPLPFFPDIYNEDWFFFAEAAAHRRLPKVGEARQAKYDPYAEPARASHEEFGDLLAEGLYSLIEHPPLAVDHRRPAEFLPTLVAVAGERYWSTAIDVRRHDMEETRSRLRGFTTRGNCSDQVFDALKSLEAAGTLYDGDTPSITPQHCVAFLDAWQRDIIRWSQIDQGSNTVGNTAEAMKRLGITTWTPVR